MRKITLSTDSYVPSRAIAQLTLTARFVLPGTRLQWDSFYIWNTICSSRLLNNVTFVLLLNKLDLLDAKLKAGVQFRRFVTSYKDKPNETDSVVGCACSLLRWGMPELLRVCYACRLQTSRASSRRSTNSTLLQEGCFACTSPARPYVSFLSVAILLPPDLRARSFAQDSKATSIVLERSENYFLLAPP